MAKRIDDSHQPFKRTKRIGPGPKKHPPVLQVKDWECKKGSSKYVQVCTYVGPNVERRGTTVTHKTKKAKKRKYNKLYRAWARKNRAKLVNKGALPSYRCKRTRNASCR